MCKKEHFADTIFTNIGQNNKLEQEIALHKFLTSCISNSPYGVTNTRFLLENGHPDIYLDSELLAFRSQYGLSKPKHEQVDSVSEKDGMFY